MSDSQAQAPPITLPAVLQEAWYGDGSGMQYFDPRDFAVDSIAGNVPINLASDRQHGEDWPRWQTETHLAWIRGMGRALADTEWGTAAIESLLSYTTGAGFDWHAEPLTKGDEQQSEAASLASKILDDWSTANLWRCDGEEEFFRRAVRDGEVFARLIMDDGEPLPRIEFIEPAEVVQPDLSTQAAIDAEAGIETVWQFGVRRYRGRVIGIFRQLESGWEYIPNVIHWARNVDRNVSRGVSDFFPVRSTLPKAAKLQAYSLDGSTTQAAISFIQELPAYTTRSQAETLVDSQSSGTTESPGIFGTVYRQVRRFLPGTVLTVKAGSQYKPGPMGAERNAGFEVIKAAAVRTVGIRWQMPEFMISGDASNANYASTLAASSPFGRARQRDQARLAEVWKEMFWRVLSMAGPAYGLDPQSLRESIRLAWRCSGADFSTESERVQASLGKLQLGIRREVIATELGYDPETDLTEAAAAQADRQQGGTSSAPAMAGLTRLQFKRNSAAIEDLLKRLIAGESPAKIKTLLLQLGLPESAADALISDAADGTLDQVHSEESESRPDMRLVLDVCRDVADGTTVREAGLAQLELLGVSREQADNLLNGEQPSTEAAALRRAWESE